MACRACPGNRRDQATSWQQSATGKRHRIIYYSKTTPILTLAGLAGSPSPRGLAGSHPRPSPRRRARYEFYYRSLLMNPVGRPPRPAPPQRLSLSRSSSHTPPSMPTDWPGRGMRAVQRRASRDLSEVGDPGRTSPTASEFRPARHGRRGQRGPSGNQCRTTRAGAWLARGWSGAEPTLPRGGGLGWPPRPAPPSTRSRGRRGGGGRSAWPGLAWPACGGVGSLDLRPVGFQSRFVRRPGSAKSLKSGRES